MANIWIILADPKFPPRHYFPHSEKDEDKHGGGCRQSVGVRSKGDKLNWKETYRGDRLENVYKQWRQTQGKEQVCFIIDQKSTKIP